MASRWARMGKGLLMAFLAVVALVLAFAEASAGGRQYLLVADTAERRIYVYRVPDMVMTGELSNILLSSHMGTFALPDGRILLSDDAAQEILAIRIDHRGVPTVVNRTAAALGGGAVWGSVDPSFRYFAVASAIENSEEQIVNLIELSTFQNTQIPVAMLADEEPHPFLGGKPLTLFVGVGGELRGLVVSEVLRDPDAPPRSRTPINLGAHGLVLSPRAGRLGITTAAGFNLVDLDCAQRRDPVCGTATIPWDIDGRAGGQNFRPRLASDGVTALGVIAGPAVSPEQWADVAQDVHVVNLRTFQAHRFLFGHGIVPRFALSRPYAVIVTMDTYGDALHLLDVEPKSRTYLAHVGTVFLERLTNGPVPGMPAAGTERRSVAVTPDGRYAFATHGGDGKISVVDTARLSVEQVTVPTALLGGGYIIAIQRGLHPVDLIAR